ncbi:MAG: hypothetical protein WAK67_00365, partial [Xanthobacteraceae bacterium]
RTPDRPADRRKDGTAAGSGPRQSCPKHKPISPKEKLHRKQPPGFAQLKKILREAVGKAPELSSIASARDIDASGCAQTRL